MTRESILLRIETIIRFIDTAHDDVGDKTLDEFSESDLLVRATCFCLVQIGEQMTNLEKELSNEYPDIPWSKAIRMRNLIVHIYNRVKSEPVYFTVKNDLPLLKESFEMIRKKYIN